MPVRAGAQAPERLRFSVANPALASEPFDFTTATAFTLKVRKPNGDRTTWDVEILEQTSTELVLEHEFSLLDVEQPGPYQLELEMAILSGVRRAGPTVLTVTE